MGGIIERSVTEKELRFSFKVLLYNYLKYLSDEWHANCIINCKGKNPGGKSPFDQSTKTYLYFKEKAMKQFIRLVAVAGMIFSFAPSTQLFAAGNPLANMFGVGFVDLNGDGINDNAPDADGDGIPNGQDPDYVRAQDGTGSRRGATAGASLTTGTGTGVCTGTGTNGSARRGR